MIRGDPKYAPIFVEADGHGRRTSPCVLRMFWTRSLWRLWLTRELMPLTSGTRLRSFRGGPHGMLWHVYCRKRWLVTRDEVVKTAFRYIKGRPRNDQVYENQKETGQSVVPDSMWASCRATRQSSLGAWLYSSSFVSGRGWCQQHRRSGVKRLQGNSVLS